ncbi:sacsin [Amia ocellicauda]|uniref:sacsin n=1 Tax=Amia ocellicauda TaxID=2972642 RepID=UPI003464718E
MKRKRTFRARAPPFIDYLKDILRRYPDGGQILKELIQNADDAKATEVIFVYDERSYSTENLWDEKLDRFQGPALLAYNNAQFTDEDWGGIQAMGQSVKNKDPNKIGRFGIGFNSIYHITDLPWIFSGTNIGVLDPQQSYLEDGGWWSVEDEEDRQQLQNYPEQFEPLRRALQETSRQTSWEDLLHGEPFRGTLFRFPLRAEASKISDNLYNHQRVFELFKSFQADSELSLLFLKNVASISMRHIDPDGNVTNHLTVTAAQDTVSEESMAGEAFSLISASETSYCLKLVSRQSPGLAEHCCKWLVSSFTARSGQDSELDELAEKMKYLPCVGLAYPLTEDNCKRPKGRLSCFLPLPDNEANWTGLPVHVNACFGLTDNRRYVKWLEEDQKYDEAAQWNELLLNQLLPPAYCQTILCAIALTQSQSSPMQPSMTYNLWPDLDNLAHKELWRKMGETMCKLLVEYKVLCSARSDTDWLKPREAIFPVTCKTEDQILGAVDDLLLAQQQPLVKVPKHVYNTVKSFFKEKLTQGTPEFLCNILRSCDLNSIAADQKLLLLEFILKDYQCVKGLQLLPLSDGTFTKFCSPGQGQTVFIDSKEFPRSLLPGLEKNFIPLNLRPALWGILNHLATKNIFNFCHLNANLVTENLKGAIPSDWASGCDKVTWKTRSPAHPPIKWLSLVWNFLAKHCTDLKPFEDLPLIPLMPLTEKADTVQLVRLTKSTNLFFQTENGHTLKNDVVSILEKLGGQVIKQGNSFLSHPHLNSYILYPSVGNVLRLLSNIGTSVVKTKLISTSTEDKNKLRQLLSTASQLTEKEKQFVSELPIFRQMPSLTSLGKECIAAQKLEAVKNETIPNIPSDVVLPETVLKCTADYDQTLFGLLKVKLLSSADVTLKIVSGIERGLYRGSNIEQMMQWILKNYSLLYNQNSAIQEKCKTLKFMDKGGTLVEPAALFDPEEETLKELFSKDFFPQKAFAEQRILKTLRVLGLRSCLGSITPDEFLAVASKLQNENSAQAYRKSDALVRVCNETDIFSKCTQSQLRALCSVPWVSAEKTSKTKGCKWYKPEELKHSALGNLVDLVMPLTSKFNQRTSKYLGISNPPPARMVMENLRRFSEIFHTEDSYSIQIRLKTIYSYIQEHLNDFTGLLQDCPIWNGDGFSQPKEIILNYPKGLDLSYQIKKVPDELSQQYQQLLKKCGIKSSLSPAEIVDFLSDLKKNIDSQAITAGPKELKFAISILEWMRTTQQDLKSLGYEESLLLPIQKNAKNEGFSLQPLSNVLFPDISSEALDDLCEDEEDFYLLHSEIPRAMSEHFCVPFLSTRILKPEFIGIEQYGQTEPIPLRIKNILKEYDEESDLFKELIQNAEDAKATECSFLVDMRQNKESPENLIDPGMSSCHGPALWSFNDEVFTEDDFKNISRVGSASKETEVEKIGNFGLGFNAVYHITDIPSILSGKTLIIFDPNVTHLRKHIQSRSNPGIKLDISKHGRLLMRFPKQFQPYQDIFGCSIRDFPFEYKGTLIKLPFRTAAEAESSEISKKVFDEHRIRSLTNTFRETCQHMLLFLKNVKKVNVKMLPQVSSPDNCTDAPTVLTLTREDVCGFDLSRDNPMSRLQQQSLRKLEGFGKKCRDIIDVNKSAVKGITLEDKKSQKVFQYWLVYSCFGTGKSLSMVCGPKKTHLFALPLGSIAVPLCKSQEHGKWAPDTEATVGQAFCFLPLSIQSGLPVHINGSFSVTSNRKNLWSSGLKGEWNKAMLEDAVTSAYVTALLQLQNMCLENKLVDYDCYMFWPNMDVVLEPFTVTAEAFYQAVAKGFCGELLQLLSNGDKWCSIENAYFLDPEISSHERIGKTAFTEFTLRLQPPRMALCLPQWVREGFSKSGCSDIIDKHTYGWKQFYTEIVFGNLDLMDATTRNTFVLFAINMRNPAIDSLLKTTACIPTGKSGKLELIRNLIHPRGKVASLFEDDDGRIPNGSEADFLHPETLSRFETLGMVKDQISISDLIERAQTVKCLWKQNKDKACRRIQSILSFLGDVKINNTEQETIQSIAFLPALSPASPENIVEENVCLMSPRTMYKTKHRWLVSMIDPVLAKHQLDLDFKMSSETCNVLGLNRKPPIDTVLLQLEKTTILQYKIDPAKTEQIVKSCYGYLNECLKKDHTSREILARKLTFPFIFVEGKFVTSNEVAHNILLNADPYLYKLPVEYKAFQDLWMTVGIQDHFCFSDYLSILQKMSQKYQKSALDKSDLDLCLRVINVGFQILIEEEPIDPYTVHSILLPDQNNVLQAIDKLHFNDTAWLKLDKDIALCHSHIPRQIAIWLGVPTTKHKALADLQVVPLSRWFKPFGAHEKLTRRLQNIIKEYPSNKDILKELIQNADDAEATEIHFIWDQRQHPEEKVLGNKWAALQGPSLCVYNNKKFTEKDIKGIQDLGEGGKAGNLEKTGKFGLGFNSVYHLTDCPSFVSGDSRLCVFDPNLFYLETASKNDPGGEFAITNNFKSSFPDVYNTYLPSFYDLEKGTMFRLPLRTEEMARSSEIKHETVTKEDITSLIQMLNEDPDGLMLFLNNIKKITFLILHRNAKEPQPVFTMEVKMSEESLNKRNEFLNKVQEAGHLQTEVMDLNPLQVFHEVEIHCTDKKPRKWILAKQVGVEEKEIKASMQDTCEKLNQKLLPHGAIAATLDTYSGGRLFCSLPLPVETGLPVHVNGNFAINCSRRDLWKEDGQNVRTEWNECLKLNLLAPLYGSLLLYIAEHLFQDRENPLRFKNEKDCENQLKAFLMLFPTDFENIHQQWHEVVVRIYQSIHARKHKVIPIVREEENVEGRNAQKYLSVTWSSVGNESTDEPHFMTEEFRHKLVDILNDMNMKFVLQSTYLTAIYKGFERASSTVTALSPQSVRKFLINHPVLSQNKILSLPLSGSPFKDEKQISILLDYCITNIKEENERSLEGLPLLLTRDNILRRFQLEDPKYLSRFYDLFPNRSYLFVNVDYSCKVDPLEKAGFLKKFTIQESVDYIKEKLVHDVSEDDCNTWPVLRKEDNEWIKRLWEFFNYTYSVNSYTNESKKTEVFMELKHLFADLAILPVWNTKQDKQKVLSSLNRLQNVVCEDNMGELLMKLGFAKYDTSLPHDIMFHVIRPNVLNIKDPSTVLQKLIQTKGLQWDALSPLDYDRLLEFLLQGLKKTNDSQVCKQIQRLPIFEMMQGSRQAIDKFRCIYILNTKEEHPELYQIDSEIAFLKKSELNLEFAKNTDIQILNDFEFFNVVILQRIEQLSEPQKLSAIRLLLKIQHKYLIEYEKSKSKIINCLRPVKFIRDKHGNLREAAFFYDENNQLFKMMNLYEKFIPQAFFKNIMPAYSLQALLIDLGMRHTASQDDLINFATQIERDAQTRTSLKELKAKTNAILNIIFKFKEQDLSADFCKKLSNIKFIYPPEVPKWLCDLHVPYHHNQFMALNGSLVAQKDKDNELIWTTFPLLPFQNSSPILKSTGALFLPPQEKVIQNLRNVARVKCETTELIKSRAMVIETSYCFFQQSKSLDTKSLSQIPVILVDNDKRLVKPNKVVISLHNENDFRPYLYKMPPLLASYRELFQKIGVTIEATTEHYGRVLRDIFEDSKDSNNLQPNQIKTSKKAVENFFRTLKMDQDFQSLKVLYLPATDGKLYSSDRLCYNDYVITGNNRDFKSLEDKFKFMVSLRECHLKWDIYEIRKKIKLLPEEMRPKMLSETTVEGLEESKLELCRFGEKCEFRQKLIKLLTSPNFSDGVIAILKWQNRGDLPQSVSSHDLKELFSTIQITCCEKLEISIFYNSVSLENSSMQKEIYISKKHNVQFDIFMKHTNVLQGRKMVKIPKTLAQEINSLLEDILNKESVFVLFEMLCCTDPEDIYNVLSENGIHSFRSEKTNYFDLPSPGDVIPEEFLDFLEMDFLSSFEVGDFVGYLDSVSPELIYRYALVKECLGYEEEADGKVEWYKIEIGDNKVIKVSKNDIYQFKATKGVKNDCWDLVPLPHAENKSEINNEKCSKSLEEIKKEIDKCFEDIEKLPKAEREKAIRRLYLKWHPDKNLDNSEIATEVCKYIQQLKEGKKPSPSNCGSSQDGQYHRSKNEWYDWFNWDKEASRHRKGKTNFNFRYPSYDYDSFRFRSRQQPNPAEAKRWMKQAEHDLSSASSDIGQSNTEWVFFKVHQAVEKALIATHYKYDGKYPKGQCILGLSQNVSMFAGSLSELSDLVHKLCQYGVDNKRTQYPIYHAIPNIPNGQFPAEKEQEVLELGKSVLYKIQNYISL